MNAAQMDYEFEVGYDAITNFSAPGYEPREKSTFLTKAQERVMLHIINPTENPLYTGVEQTQKRRVDLSEYVRSASCALSATQAGSRPNGMFYNLPADFFYMLSEDARSSQADCKKAGQKRIILTDAYDPSSYHFLVGETISITDLSGAPGNVVGTYVVNSGGGRQLYVTLASGTYPSGVSIGFQLTGVTSGATALVRTVVDPLISLLVRPVTHDYVTANAENPFKKPYDELCWRMDYSRETPVTSLKRVELITDGTYTIEEYFVRYYRRPKAIIVPTPATFPAYTVDTESSSLLGTNCELDEIIHRQIIDEAVRLAVAALQETDSYAVKTLESTKSE